VAVWDPRSQELHLVTDRLGQRPLYVAGHAGGTLVASELKALVAAGLQPTLDPQAWAELLAFEYPLGESVPLAGVRLVPQASTLTLSRSGPEVLRERWRYRYEPRPSGDELALRGDLEDLLRQAVVRRLDATTGLALSGGLDSRCLAAVLAEHAPGTPTATYGQVGSEDFVVGARVAERAGLPHRALPLAPGYLARGAAETVWLGEGIVRCFHAHHLALRPLRAEAGIRSLLIGFAGDVVLRGHEVEPAADLSALARRQYDETALCVGDALAREVLAPQFASTLQGRARDSVLRHLAAEEGDLPARLRQFSFRHNRMRMLWGTELFADDIAPRDPFGDADLIDFCRRMPERLRLGGTLQRGYLARFPALAGLRNPKDGLAPSLTGWRRRAATEALRVRRRARRALDDTVVLSSRPNRAGLADYAGELRNGSAGLLSILLEPRTLDRGQIRRAGVTRLVEETLRGRRNHARALGMLLTLELFQRQFVDGDGAP
jgi:asparagine synthase (glutamine-hydrolysing)